MTCLYLLFALALLAPTAARGHDGGAVAVAVPLEGITLDGDLADWPADLPRYTIEKISQTDNLDSTLYHGAFRLGYGVEEQALYVAVEITDNSLLPTYRGQPNNQDGCEIFLDESHLRASSQPLQYWIWGDFRGMQGLGSLDNARVAVQRSADTHRYEWRIQLGAPVRPGQVLGLDVATWDVDADGAKRYVSWGQGFRQWNATDQLGDLLLAADPAPLGRLEGRIQGPNDQSPGAPVRIQLYPQTAPDKKLEVIADRSGQFALHLPAASYGLAGPGPRQNTPRRLEIHPQKTTAIALPLPRPEELAIEAGPGRRVAAGPGQRTLAGPGRRQGHWHSWGVSDGLPPASVGALFQDDSGALWIGTGRDEGEYEEGKGVVRYDGAEFTHFTTADGLAHNSVFAIAQDGQGVLWFGTWGGGLSRYDGQHFTTYTKADGLPDDRILTLAVDHDGYLWAGGLGGLARFDGRTWIYLPYDLRRITDLSVDGRGRLWIATYGIGLYCYDRGEIVTYTPADGLADPFVSALAADGQGGIWVRTNTGLSHLADGRIRTLTAADGLHAEFAPTIALDQQGRLWDNPYFGGTYRYDGQQFRAFDTGDGLVHNFLLASLADRDGNMWFGALGGGISRYDDVRVTTYTTADGLPHNAIAAVLEYGGDNLWVNTWGGPAHFDGQSFSTAPLENLPPNLELIGGDQKGYLWFSGSDGLLRFSDDHQQTFGPEQGVPPGGLAYTLKDDGLSERIWFGSREGWLGHFDGERFFPFKLQLSFFPTGGIATDGKGQQWIGSNEGLYRYDGQDLVKYTAADGLPGDDIRALLVDAQDRVWVGTWGQGLGRFDGQRWTTFTTADGLSHDRILHLNEDDRGRLWIATWGGGVNVFDGTVFQHLLKADGLAHNVLQGLSLSRYGGLWVATEGGLTRYRPQSAPPTIRLTDVVSDRPHGPVERLRLPSSRPYLRLAFQGASFHTPPQRMVYLYRLLGHDSQWRQTRQTHVAYTDLPIGHYTFEVKAVDRDLNYSPQPARLELEVFYQPVQTSVQIAAIGLDDVFASFYPTYADQAIGQVDLVNADADSIQATLRFFVPGLMPRPVDRPVTLPPQTTRQVALHAPLDAGLLAVEQTRTFTAEIALQIASGDQTLALQDSRPLTVHAPGALTWDTAARAAAFIAPTHAAIEAFARPLIAAHETALQALGQPGRNLLTAGLLFEGLKAHGIRYLADANTPYSSVAADRAAVDRVRYPAQLLQHKAGDCDDLTVLYAALLENAGVPTALVDVPGHLLLMIDSGVARRQRQRLPLDERQFVLWGDRLWIPVEVTRLDGSFIKAWDQGLQQVARQQARFVATADAWERFPPTAPEEDTPMAPTTAEVLQGAMVELQSTLDQRVEQHIRQTYLEPLADQDDEALRLRLLQLYLALARYDTAIEAATDFLLDERGDPATHYLQLGHAYFFKGEIAQAALQYKQAKALRPDDAGIDASLQRALEGLGRTRPKAPAASAPLAGDAERKAGLQALDIDDFYWGID